MAGEREAAVTGELEAAVAGELEAAVTGELEAAVAGEREAVVAVSEGLQREAVEIRKKINNNSVSLKMTAVTKHQEFAE